MQHQLIEYKHENTTLEGYLAYDDKITGPRPAVLIVHAWGGRDEFVCRKADALAEMGYVGFAIDMYGQGILGGSKEENAKLMEPFANNRSFLQQRILAGLSALQAIEQVDKHKIAGMGFCFGGLCALDLARSGADIRGVVSFHGSLIPNGLPTKPIKAKLLILHGYNDPMVPPEQVNAFANEMTVAKADWQIHMYGQTMHAFTNPVANDPSFGTVYSASADRRSWQAMQGFFSEIFS